MFKERKVGEVMPVGYLRQPSFSERIIQGHCTARLVEERFYVRLEEGDWAVEGQKFVGREVSCAYGRVDVLLTDWVVELKSANSWKQGIGQLIVYGTCWPEKKLWLHLYSNICLKRPWKYIAKVEDVCEQLGIRATFDVGGDGMVPIENPLLSF